MAPKFLFHKVSLGLVIAGLAFTPGSMMAQSLPEDDHGADAPAATEVIVSSTMTLDMAAGGFMTAATQRVQETKPSVQETTQAFPSVTDINQEGIAKRHFFLPLISHTGELNATVEAAEATADWDMRPIEGFEGRWPNAQWITYDCNGSANGTYYWDDENWISNYGYWSGWPAGNQLDPRFDNYRNNTCAGMVYGPFSMQGALSGLLSFSLWSMTEPNYDWIGWHVSCDYVNWSGSWTSGSTNGWVRRTLSLDSCLGDSTVWIGFWFTSDSSITAKGPFIDDIWIDYLYP